MFVHNLALAFKSLKRNPALTALMVVAIAVGMGACMTTLTVLHALSGDPLPGRSEHLFYPQVDPVKDVPYAHSHPLDMMDYQSATDLWRAHRADRQALIVHSMTRVSAAGTGQPPLMKAMLSTTSDFFSMFEVRFEYGSGWTPQDDAHHNRVAVISSALNNRLFRGENSVGRTLMLRGDSVRIVGVLGHWRPSPLFYDVAGGRYANGQTADFYRRPEDVMTPFYTGLEINDGNFQQFTCWHMPDTPGHLEDAPCAWVALWVELDTPARANAYRRFLANYAAQQKSLGRIDNASDTRMFSLMQWLHYNGVVPSDVRLLNWLAFAFLFICLCNTVGLLLARFLRRRREISVRRALGASRAQIFTQYLVEAGLIGLLGGVAGFVLTLAGLWLVRRQPVAYADLARLDMAMLATTFAGAVLASLLAGALPALRASRIAPATYLNTM